MNIKEKLNKLSIDEKNNIVFNSLNLSFKKNWRVYYTNSHDWLVYDENKCIMTDFSWKHFDNVDDCIETWNWRTAEILWIIEYANNISKKEAIKWLEDNYFIEKNNLNKEKNQFSKKFYWAKNNDDIKLKKYLESRSINYEYIKDFISFYNDINNLLILWKNIEWEVVNLHKRDIYNKRIYKDVWESNYVFFKEIKLDKDFLLVEWEIDYLTLKQNKELDKKYNIIWIPGINLYKYFLENIKTNKNIYILADNDDTEDNLKELLKSYKNTFIINDFLKDFDKKDVNDYIQEYSDLESKIEENIIIYHELSKIKDEIDKNTVKIAETFILKEWKDNAKISIANFGIKLDKIIIKDEEKIRFCIINLWFNKGFLELKNDDLSLQNFKNKIREITGASFTWNSMDLDNVLKIIDLQFISRKEKEIKEINKTGFFKDYIVFKNGILDTNRAEFKEINDNSEVKIKNKPLFLNIEENLYFENIQKEETIEESFKNIFNFFDELLNKTNEWKILALWLLSSIFKHDILDDKKNVLFGGFPFLYLSWLRWSWKTELQSMIFDIVWYKINKIVQVNTITNFALIKELDSNKYFLGIDEFNKTNKNYSDVVEKIKNNFNWESNSRWWVEKWKWAVVKYYENKANLIVWWEDITNNEALFTRWILIKLWKNTKMSWYSDFKNKNIESVRNSFLNILLKKKELKNSIFNNIKEIRKTLDWKFESRILDNLSILWWIWISTKSITEDNTMNYLDNYIEKIRDIEENNDVIREILEEIKYNYYEYKEFLGKNTKGIYFRSLKQIYNQFKKEKIKRSEIIWDFNQIKEKFENHFNTTPYAKSVDDEWKKIKPQYFISKDIIENNDILTEIEWLIL